MDGEMMKIQNNLIVIGYGTSYLVVVPGCMHQLS